MNGQTLQALRGFLFFTAPEAARMIGNVQERSWRRWEADGAPVPKDVEDVLRGLIGARNQMLKNASDEIDKAGKNAVILTYYANFDDWLESPIMWRVHCSVMAELAVKYPNVNLVTFDSVAYNHWLDGRPDGQANRAVWAAIIK